MFPITSFWSGILFNQLNSCFYGRFVAPPKRGNMFLLAQWYDVLPDPLPFTKTSPGAITWSFSGLFYLYPLTRVEPQWRRLGAIVGFHIVSGCLFIFYSPHDQSCFYGRFAASPQARSNFLHGPEERSCCGTTLFTKTSPGVHPPFFSLHFSFNVSDFFFLLRPFLQSIEHLFLRALRCFFQASYYVFDLPLVPCLPCPALFY